MVIALIALGFVFGFLLAVLACPVDLSLHLTSGPPARFLVTARLLGGMIPAIRLSGHEGKESLPGPAPKVKKKRKTGARTPATLSAFTGLIRDALGAIELRQLSMRAVIGLGDPAETGQLYGMLTPLQYGPWRAGVVSVSPDFDRAHLSGELSATLRVTPIALALPLARFGWQMGRAR